MQDLYSLENTKKFNWSSVSGDLNPERVSHLRTYLLGRKILDAGCGGGAYAEFLSKEGFKVTGVDKHEQFLHLIQNTNPRGTYIQGDITELPLTDKEFDCIYCFDVLEHVDDKAAIRELARITKQRLIIAVPKDDDDIQRFGITFAHYQDKTHLRNYTEDSLRSLLRIIEPSNVDVFLELLIPAKKLICEMLDFNIQASGLSYIYKRVSNSLLYRLLNINIFSYKQIYTGLVAVVDL